MAHASAANRADLETRSETAREGVTPARHAGVTPFAYLLESTVQSLWAHFGQSHSGQAVDQSVEKRP
jgi:hypothetical protein